MRHFPIAFTGLTLMLAASNVVAQPLGVFRWQLQPYCNVVALAVTQNGAVITLDGTDDQCGAGPAASVVGIAFFNPDGSVGMGLNLVVAPGAAPVHVTATINTTTLGGTWADSAGHSGALVFGPPSPAPGPPRPGGGLSGVAVTTITAGAGLTGSSGPGAVNLAVAFGGTGGATTAARSDHTHAVGAAAANNTAVGVDALPSSTGAGNTAFGRSSLFSNTTGANNTAVGVAALNDNSTGFENTALGRSTLSNNTTGFWNTAVGYGSLFRNTTASRNTALGHRSLFGNTTGNANTALGENSLFTNETGDGNTAVGSLSLSSNTAGDLNTAVGSLSLSSNTAGSSNTAVGSNALFGNSTGDGNTALGRASLFANTGGGVNTAVGYRSMLSNTTGVENTALGHKSLENNTSGSDNIAIGDGAGSGVTTGSNNIHIGHPGGATENNTIRIGRLLVGEIGGGPHARTFLAGVRNRSTGNNNAIPVLIDSAGQLGTTSSTRRTKEGIVDLGAPGLAVQRLRPVQFQYRQPFADGTKPLQYGLIAEEVADVLPELVAHDDAGQPASVKYHVLPTLLVAEVQRLERERLSLEATVVALRAELAALRGQNREIAALEQRLADVERLLTTREER